MQIRRWPIFLFSLGMAFFWILPIVLAQAPSLQPSKGTGSKADIQLQGPDFSKLSLYRRHIFLSARRGVAWLVRANRPGGRFVYGHIPALWKPLEGDDYLRQVGTVVALGRAARYFQDAQADAIARQAILTLLLETRSQESGERFTIPPDSLISRVASAGWLLAAIHELQSPGKDLLEQAEQLGNFLRGQQNPDGSFRLGETGLAEAEAIGNFTGPALYGLVRSQGLEPGRWKVETVIRGRTFYQAFWRKHKNLPMLPTHSAAYTEAYLLTRDRALAECVFEMNDWLCGFQYSAKDPHHPTWGGGFKPIVEGKGLLLAPDIQSALAAESLVQACRLARQMGDVPRYERYRQALENCLQFLTTLQYTDANVQHFDERYRPFLVGAFHASLLDGNLRLDFTAQAVSAMVQYLNYLPDLP